ncbi:hypothetical protein [Hydrogenophaga luteola]|uniref:DUF3592 domain-containing protein n=1 Tax=Hydrogenophaga luteola TaxID=1591122 RepID=A0ABV7W592_9BURK
MNEFLSDFALQLVLGLACGVLALPFVFVRRRTALADRERLGREGKRAQGHVLEVWRDAEGWNLTYEFTPDGHTTPVRKTESYEGAQSAPAAVGATIQVAYEGHAPFYSVPVLPAPTARAHVDHPRMANFCGRS